MTRGKYIYKDGGCHEGQFENDARDGIAMNIMQKDIFTKANLHTTSNDCGVYKNNFFQS